MAKNFFKRYVWLITTIYRHKYITRADINRLWEHSQLNELHEKFSERTFHHHRDAIEEMFGIRILCDRSQGYYIANRDDWENDGIQEWLLESMAMNDLVNETSDMRDRILFENVPSSEPWLSIIVNAMLSAYRENGDK